MEPIQVLTWVVIVVFAFTAVITLGGLVENFALIKVKEVYLKKLFVALILEIIAVCIPLSTEAIRDSRCGDECIAEKIQNLDPDSDLAKKIIAMRNRFTGIFKIPEYAIEITFDTVDEKNVASVCPESPLFNVNLAVFNGDRKKGVFVHSNTPAPKLCTTDKVYKVVISKEWAKEEFKIQNTDAPILGIGSVLPPVASL